MAAAQEDTKPDVKPAGLSAAALKKQQLYTTSRSSGTPFPQWQHPTPEEAKEVCDLLASVHGMPERPKVLVDRPDAPAGCGQVPSVLDALVRTILSQNTTSKNSTTAKRSMDEVYGRAGYRAVLDGGQAKLEEAIRCGGLAKNKSKAILGVLQRIEDRNVQEKGMKPGEGELSLDWLHELDDEAAMKELISFDLVGIKTASCVLLFCLGRDSFAVDTHVHRITQSLGWLPPNGSVYSAPDSSTSTTPSKSKDFTRLTKTTQPPSRDQTFFHLDHLLPAHLKYPLHSLIVRHGRGCVRCAANGVTTQDFVDTCPIDHLVRRAKGKGKRVPVKDAQGETVGTALPDGAAKEGAKAEFEPLADAAEERIEKAREELGEKKGDAVKLEDETGQPARDGAEVASSVNRSTRKTRAKRGAVKKEESDEEELSEAEEKPAPAKRARKAAPTTEEKPLTRSTRGRAGLASSKASTAKAQPKKARKAAGEASVNRDEAEMGGQVYTMHGLDV
ncbi:uncharacterized protein JCM10292_006542 [Rhodotorula paludigena]|uniref:uncharacterized protein n=1 Tax=Rhodotorula paludigena TaxID=86838 RepID=UPI00317141A1